MSILNKGSNLWLVRVRKVINGKIHNRIKVVSGLKQDARQVESVLLNELLRAQSSLTLQEIIYFNQALTYYQEHTEADLSRVETYFRRLKRELGGIPIQCLSDSFGSYWRLLKTERVKRTGELLTNCTRNKLLKYSKVALNFCVKRKVIKENPLQYFELLPETSRNRVLSDDECDRITNVMKRRDSYLYWPFIFSLKNPIRKGDFQSLTRDNFDWFKPWVHFYPSKTRKKKNRETYLPFLDSSLLSYFKSLPGDCPYLFPYIDKKGNWHKLNDFRKHWYSILNEAKVSDFRWHDLKHCAITWILDNGYSERDLKNLGIQYSPEMINRYYFFDANKVLEKMKNGTENEKNQGVVALQNGTYAPEGL